MSRRTGFDPEVAAAILLRDGDRCSMEGFPGCPGATQRASDPGHRLNRGQGGDPRPFINSLANGAGQHHGCNWKLEQIEEFAEEGRRRGCKLDHSGDDEAAIHGTPMWHPFFGQWVVLRPGGMFLTGERDASLDARGLVVVGSEGAGFRLERVGALNNPVFEATGVRA
jgi:hypothetical protein